MTSLSCLLVGRLIGLGVGGGVVGGSSLTYLVLGLISAGVTGWLGHMSFIIQQISLGLFYLMAEEAPSTRRKPHCNVLFKPLFASYLQYNIGQRKLHSQVQIQNTQKNWLHLLMGKVTVHWDCFFPNKSLCVCVYVGGVGGWGGEVMVEIFKGNAADKLANVDNINEPNSL